MTRFYSLSQFGRSAVAPLGYLHYTASIQVTDMDQPKLSTFASSIEDRAIHIRIEREQAAALILDWRRLSSSEKWRLERWTEREAID